MKVYNINNYKQTTKNSTTQSCKNPSFGSIEIKNLNKVLGPAQEVFSNELAAHINSLIEAVKNYRIGTIINKAKKIRKNILEFTDSDGQKLSKEEIGKLQTNLATFIKKTGNQLSKNTKLKFIDDKTFRNDVGVKTTLSLQEYTKKIQFDSKYSSSYVSHRVYPFCGILFDEIPAKGVPLSKKISMEINDNEILGGKKELIEGRGGYGYDSDDCESHFYSNVHSAGTFEDEPGIFVSNDETRNNCGLLLHKLFGLLSSRITTKYEEAELDKIIITAKQSKAVVGRLEKEKAAANAGIEAQKSRIKGIFE